MENEDPRTICGRQTFRDGQFFTCPGVIEVRVPLYFDRSVSRAEGLKLLFTALGGLGEDDAEGITMSCSECGKSAPRIYYAGVRPVLEALEAKLRGLFD